MAEEFHVKMPGELRRLIEGMADEQCLPMGEVALKIIANGIGRPDLGFVPRKPMGRPRKEAAAGK